MTKYLAALLAAFPLLTTALAQTPVATDATAEFSTCVRPEWPKESLRKEQQGTVQLAFLIGADGNVQIPAWSAPAAIRYSTARRKTPCPNVNSNPPCMMAKPSKAGRRCSMSGG